MPSHELDGRTYAGRYDVDGNTAIRPRYLHRMAGVACGIERHTEPFEPLRNPCPDTDGVFANTSGKDERIKALQGGRQHSGLESDPVDKIVDGKRRAGIAAVQ